MLGNKSAKALIRHISPSEFYIEDSKYWRFKMDALLMKTKPQNKLSINQLIKTYQHQMATIFGRSVGGSQTAIMVVPRALKKQ